MRRTITALAIVALTLAGCANTDTTTNSDDARSRVPIETIEPQSDWLDEDQKLRTFLQYVCIRDGADSPIDQYTHATSAAVGVMADSTASPEDKEIALGIITRPKEWYEQAHARHEASIAVGEYSTFDEVAPTLIPNDPDICEGWVWERHIEQAYVKEFDEFTFDEAREMNAI